MVQSEFVSRARDLEWVLFHIRDSLDNTLATQPSFLGTTDLHVAFVQSLCTLSPQLLPVCTSCLTTLALEL